MDTALFSQVRSELETAIERVLAEHPKMEVLELILKLEKENLLNGAGSLAKLLQGVRAKLDKLQKVAAIGSLSEADDFRAVFRGARMLADWKLCFKVLQTWEKKGGREDPNFYVCCANLDFTDGMKRFLYERIVELATSAGDDQMRAKFKSRLLDFNVPNYQRATLENQFFTVCLPQSKTDKGGGCFIATAVYGDGARQVRILQHFRDGVLEQSQLGRTFIAVYYRYGPGLSGVVSRRPWLSAFFRSVLDQVVRLLERSMAAVSESTGHR